MKTLYITVATQDVEELEAWMDLVSKKGLVRLQSTIQLTYDIQPDDMCEPNIQAEFLVEDIGWAP